jgi:hypothetical protein
MLGRVGQGNAHAGGSANVSDSTNFVEKLCVGSVCEACRWLACQTETAEGELLLGAKL